MALATRRRGAKDPPSRLVVGPDRRATPPVSFIGQVLGGQRFDLAFQKCDPSAESGQGEIAVVHEGLLQRF